MLLLLWTNRPFVLHYIAYFSWEELLWEHMKSQILLSTFYLYYVGVELIYCISCIFPFHIIFVCYSHSIIFIPCLTFVRFSIWISLIFLEVVAFCCYLYVAFPVMSIESSILAKLPLGLYFYFFRISVKNHLLSKAWLSTWNSKTDFSVMGQKTTTILNFIYLVNSTKLRGFRFYTKHRSHQYLIYALLTRLLYPKTFNYHFGPNPFERELFCVVSYN